MNCVYPESGSLRGVHHAGCNQLAEGLISLESGGNLVGSGVRTVIQVVYTIYTFSNIPNYSKYIYYVAMAKPREIGGK